MKREKFGSRLGFILVSAGCAIGLGNVWKFPYMTGMYGGAAFILIYLLFLAILGLPIIVCEFSVGRASQKSIATSYNALEPTGSRWHNIRWLAIAGNYILVMFYSMVGGWMLYYCFRIQRYAFESVDPCILDGTGHPDLIRHLQHRTAKRCRKSHESCHALPPRDHGRACHPFRHTERLR